MAAETGGRIRQALMIWSTNTQPDGARSVLVEGYRVCLDQWGVNILTQCQLFPVDAIG